jgi:hypothetical protein
VDPSALIFVALAVAWAAYLIPKALQHHDDAVRSRSVDRFSHTMRVLARREPVNRRDARLVVNRPTAPVAERVATPPAPESPAETSAPERRRAAVAAARRRRRVFLALLALNAVVLALAAASVVAWVGMAVPLVLLAAWLVACRLMVKKERAVAPATSRRPAPVERREAPVLAEDPLTEDVPVVAAESVDEPVPVRVATDPALWDPVPVTLPTYVGKPAAARRTVRTIELDDTGVWTSGRSEADSLIAREAEAAERAARSRDDGDASRAVGS